MSISSPTRRGILSAIAIAPVVIAMPVMAAPSPTWDAGLARYQRSYAAAEANGWEDDDLANAQHEAWSYLMHMPAPHNKALHWKLDQLYGKPERDGSATEWNYDLVVIVVEDARRLAA